MKLLLRFLFTLSLVFLGSAQRSGAHLYIDSGVRVQSVQIADHTRTLHITDCAPAELRGRSLGQPPAQEELVVSDTGSEDDREEEELQLTAKQLPPPHFFRTFLSDGNDPVCVLTTILPKQQSLCARCVAPSARVLFQNFRI